ncbi:MAG: phytanoyl-CoA dioxygenase family protein [Parasphingorhabdus sp.]|uniref:phytanoyl-CoA dioxygenase family protein n=1 Tax=Parasphingorhabdus sp. TaxID=2709688 RepID=UPI003266C0BE
MTSEIDGKTWTLEDARKQYDEDGATVLRGVIDPEWIQKLTAGAEPLQSKGAPSTVEFSRPGEGRFFQDSFGWVRIEEYKDFLFKSDIAELARDMMQSEMVRFFYDQTLVKEPGTPKKTPWHQDYAYWPANGEQIISFWIPLDAATPETGVVTYVKGSHKWNSYIPVEGWSDNNAAGAEIFGDTSDLPPEALVERSGENPKGKQLRTLADIRDHPEKYDLLSWDVEPGDVLIHHSHTIHGAPGNLSADKRRRAISFRFFGDGVTWDETRPHFMRIIKKNAPHFPYPEHETGDPITAPIFPVLWPKMAGKP